MPKKILLIEDETVMARMYRDRFQKEGFEVTLAFSAEEGLKKVEETKPDLILLDILLPKADGIEFLRRLREKEDEVADTTVVALSNYDVPDTKSRAEDLGAKDYLMKADYTPKTLVEKIKGYVNGD